jgi:hypothetical protein
MGVEVKVIDGIARLTGRVGRKAPGVLPALDECLWIRPPQEDHTRPVIVEFNDAE